ncbi:BRCA1-associated protein-like [Tropilaelaps mercedesae]|uniref:BRCA1-associated protein-like n=1 Tax=Tropilaelaps mercedesae TaxID=418985 RepID=A0A1V9X330_9ACAR|nr:BRCA1-associated protein-like [Tropilaelaps mercedesae]
MTAMSRNVHFVRIRIQLEPGCEAIPQVAYSSEKSKRDELQLIGLPKINESSSPEEVVQERLGRRRFGEIRIETLVRDKMDRTESQKNDGTDNERLQLAEVVEGLSDDPRGSVQLEQIHFFSGNHCVEVTKGILHLFKEDRKTTIDPDGTRSLMLCMMAVPTYLPLHDLLQFVAPFSPHTEHIRVIRDGKPNAYMVLLRFRSQKATDEFYEGFNGKPFNSIEGDICHLVYIAKVEVISGSSAEDDRTDSYSWTQLGAGPITGHTELPTCPVCLERMDESVEGVLTILCNHSFHDACLAKWHGDNNTCPVCRYTQTPQQETENCCQTCGATENLWICLVCGHIGCGRYVAGHANTHYSRTEHTFAMQLDNHSVWDYTGDNYVHRLVQNKTDGKLVQLESSVGGATMNEKVDSVQLEYTYLLTSQLEQQRRFFEESLEQQAKESTRQIEELKEKTRIAIEERKQLEGKMGQVIKERDSSRKKLEAMTAQCAKIKKELQDERQLSQCLLADQKVWQTRLEELEANTSRAKQESDNKIGELEEQLRDVLFFLEAKSKIEKQPEELREDMAGGSIVLNPSSIGSGHSTNNSSTSGRGTANGGARPRKSNRKK